MGKIECPNLRSAFTHSSFISQQIEKELSKGYIIGPYSKPPFDNYRINPIGVAIRKFSGKKRRIDDLSWPHGESDFESINSMINKEAYSLSYVKVDDAIAVLNQLGRSCMLCKTDIVDAFKLVPVRKELWHLYGFKWKDSYYFSVRLPFGSRSSPKIFDALSTAIVWIAKHNYGIPWLFHLLDDFLAICPPFSNADQTMASLLLVFDRLKVPISPAKTEGPSLSLIWLGLLINTHTMQMLLPSDKKKRIIEILQQFLSVRSCSKRELLSLLGHLNFACRVIPAGRSFISRLIQCSCSKPNLEDRVYLDYESTRDIDMWFSLLSNWNGISMFLENDAQTAESLHLETDASGLGYGGIYKTHYFMGTWPPELTLSNPGMSIAFQELYPIVVAAKLWGPEWSRKRIMFYSDNKATVQSLNKGRSHSPEINKLIRSLVILATKHSFMFSAHYLEGIRNSTADAISRFQIDKFRELAPLADPHPTRLPDMTDVMLN